MSATPSTDPRYVEPPTFWGIARRPKWIGALLLCLAVAAIFAALGQWQAGRAVANAIATGPNTETPVALTSVTAPREQLTDKSAGRRVEVSGRYDTTETTLLSGRYRVGVRDGLGGATGWWVVVRFETDGGASLAVATGWAPTRAQAAAAAERIPSRERSIVGRYSASESPAEDDPTKSTRSALSAASLVNEWADPGPTYDGYLAGVAATPGLERIIAPKPEAQGQLDLLNVFYAVEWAVFAGFALYLWYRLVKDQLETEIEERGLQEAERDAEEAPRERMGD